MLKILVVNDVFPNINNRTTILFKNIIPLLSKKFQIKVYWIVTDDYGKRYKETNSNYEVLFLSDFKNAREAIEKIKPNIIYHLIGYSITDYAFMLAGRLLKIPSFGYADSSPADYFAVNTSRLRVYREYFRQFFEKGNIEENNNIKKMRGLNFLKKYFFLIKTLHAIGYSLRGIILELLELELGIREIYLPQFNAKFNCDLMFVENSRNLEYHVKAGLKRENMIVVGNPVFDNAFEKRVQNSEKIHGKLNVLFLTANFATGQGKSDWTISKRDHMILELLERMNEFNRNVSLTIKIHPTSESYQQYEKLLKKYTEVHLLQNEDVIDLINKSDVILTSCTSTAGIIALIMKKPIVVWNYFNVQHDLFLRKKVVLECKNNSELLNDLQMAKSFRDKNEERIENLIEKEFVNGKSVQKTVNEIEKWVSKIGIR